MYTYIKKRDGRRAAFRQAKIMSAIERAGLETGEFGEVVADKLAEKVVARATKEISEKVPTVEQIQDIVEEILLESRYKKTAKAYIIYRDQHKKLREIASGAHVDLVDQYLAKLDWRVNENSNMDYSLQGLNNYISSEVSKTYWLNKIYSPSCTEVVICISMTLISLVFIVSAGICRMCCDRALLVCQTKSLLDQRNIFVQLLAR